MLIYILITVLVVYIGLYVKKIPYSQAPSDRGLSRRQAVNFFLLLTIFLILFGLSALRYQVGNDYPRYEEFFHLIPLKQVVPTEVGFNLSVLALQAVFGGEAARPIFAVYALVTVWIMLAAVYRGSRDFAFSFFLFMTLSYYFQSLNTVRYYLAWAVALYAWRFVMRREYLKLIIVVALTATIHKSILLILPLYLLADLSLKRWHYLVLTACAAAAYVARGPMLGLIIRLYPSYEGTSYLSGGTSYINILRIVLVALLGLICLGRYGRAYAGDREIGFWLRLNFFALLLYTCGSFIPEVSRLGYYMTGGHIFLLPALIAALPGKKKRLILKALVCAAAVVYFAAFLYLAREPLVRIVPYHSWIFS